MTARLASNSRTSCSLRTSASGACTGEAWPFGLACIETVPLYKRSAASAQPVEEASMWEGLPFEYCEDLAILPAFRELFKGATWRRDGRRSRVGTFPWRN